jgi:hypothetical protein
MKFPRLKIVKLQPGQTSKAARNLRIFLFSNLLVCSYLYIKSSKDLPATPDQEAQKEAEILSN